MAAADTSVAMKPARSVISDSIIAPKPFSNATDTDPEVWLNYFLKFADFKQLNESDKMGLFAMLLHGPASDWFSTLSLPNGVTFALILDKFKAQYYPSSELKWREMAKLWHTKQGESESVNVFLTRLKVLSRRLKITEESLHYAFLNGLKPHIRLHCLQNGVTTLDNTLRSALIAEVSGISDPMTSLILDLLKKNSAAMEQQLLQMTALAEKVNALTICAASQQKAVASQVTVASVSAELLAAQAANKSKLPERQQERPRYDKRANYGARGSRGFSAGPQRFNPQREQRGRYPVMQTEHFAQQSGQQQGAPPSQSSPSQHFIGQGQGQGEECGCCGLVHSRVAMCSARSAMCYACSKYGHFARVCFSGGRARGRQGQPRSESGRLPDHTSASQRTGERCNLVAAQIADFRVKALVDSGSMLSLISAEIFDKIKEQDAQTGARSFDYRADVVDMIAANTSPMKAIASIDTQIQVAGVIIPITLQVVPILAYELIIGLDMLQQTQSTINFGNNTLSIFNDVISVPLMRSLSATTVYTVCNVSIPPMSQAILQVKAPRMKIDRDFVIEGDTFAHHKSLMIGRTLVSTDSGPLQCLVLNPSDKSVRMRTGTPIGSLHAVSAATQLIPDCRTQNLKVESHISHEDKLKALEAKGASFKDTAAKGEDFVQLIDLLYEYRDLMANSLQDLHPEGADVPPYVIDVGNALPVRQRQYKLSPEDKREVERQVQEMFQAGIISPSQTPFINPLVVVSKASGERRVCVDSRRLNSITRLTSFPLPTMSDVIDQMADQRPIYFTSLDLFSGYWQIPLAEESRHLSGFQTSTNTWEFNRLNFGLSGAVNGFCQRMLGVLGKLASTFCAVYLDDIVVVARSHAELRDNMKQVFDKFRTARLKLKAKKCHFATDKIVFLGHVFAEGTVAPNTSKFKIIEEFPSCKTVKQVRQFLGLTGFYRRHIKGYSTLSHPLRMLLRDSVKFHWSESCEISFRKLKAALMTEPVLQLPDPTKNFYVFTDASHLAVGYWIGQKHASGAILPVSYGGRSLTPAEQNYTITELECLSLICCLKEYRHLISNQMVTYCYTDHCSLSYLKTMPLSKNARLVRWSMYLQGYQLEIIYKSSANMTHVDCLSRIDRSQNVPPVAPPSNTNETDVKTVASATTMTVTDHDIPADSSSSRIEIHFGFDTPQTAFTVAASTPYSVIFPNHEEVILEQQTCSDFGPMHKFLSTGELPTCDKAARKIMLDKDNFIMENGALYHLYRPRTKKLERCFAEIKQLVIPTSMRAIVAHGLHERLSHPGWQRCYATSRGRFYFKDQYVFLKNHVISCESCQKSKPPVNRSPVPVKSLPVREPLSHWIIDHHGPYVSDSQYKYILVAVDSSSLWVEAIPVVSTDAKTTIQAIFDNIIARFGLAEGFSIQSDRGSAFANELAKSFCDTFGIAHYFSAPGNPRSNSRAEKMGQILHQSLKSLTDSDSNWAASLQAVCLAYRATGTSSTQVSPFETLFGRRMLLHCDFAMLASDPALGSALTYAEDIRPKIKVLQEIAMHNSQESARNAADRANVLAKEPTFTVGSKVLLLDNSSKVGQSRKLRREWVGPFVITKALGHHNFRLKHLVTGMEPKNAVNANRLRTFHELNNDYRLRVQGNGVVLFDQTETQRQLKIQIVVGNILSQSADIAVLPTDCLLKHNSGISQSVSSQAGDAMREECRQFIEQNGPLLVTQPMITTSGELAPDIGRLMHVVGPNLTQEPFQTDNLLAQKAIEDAYYNCLMLADQTDGLHVITLPAICHNFYGLNMWPLAQAVACAVKRFITDTATSPGGLKCLLFMNLTLSLADVMSTVFRESIPVIEDVSRSTSPMEAPNPPTPPVDSLPSAESANTCEGWVEIECLLKHRKRKSGDQYLVQWKDSDETTWEPRANITAYAIQQFYKTQRSKRRKRRN